jgi:ribonucleotide monophosphatase NagD (HAD superfamily)
MPISFVVDMDGVIYHGSRLIPGALDFVERLRAGGHKFLKIERAIRLIVKGARFVATKLDLTGPSER